MSEIPADRRSRSRDPFSLLKRTAEPRALWGHLWSLLRLSAENKLHYKQACIPKASGGPQAQFCVPKGLGKSRLTINPVGNAFSCLSSGFMGETRFSEL